jgi:GINS complex subunit 4
MTEVLDLHGQDSDGGSEEMVLTPAELIEKLEQVSTPNMSRVLSS